MPRPSPRSRAANASGFQGYTHSHRFETDYAYQQPIPDAPRPMPSLTYQNPYGATVHTGLEPVPSPVHQRSEPYGARSSGVRTITRLEYERARRHIISPDFFLQHGVYPPVPDGGYVHGRRVEHVEPRRRGSIDSSHLHQYPWAPSRPDLTVSHPNIRRPHEARTFPKPPTRASSIMGASTEDDWYESNPQLFPNVINSSQSSSIETNMKDRSKPTTPATNSPSLLESPFPYNPEDFNDTTATSLQDDVSSIVNLLSLPSITPYDAFRSSDTFAQISPTPSATVVVHDHPIFPSLGLPNVRNHENFPCDDQLAPPLQSHSSGPALASSTFGEKHSPSISDTSSSDWTEDGQDPDILRLISVSCSILLSAYLKSLVQSKPSKSKQNDGDRSQPTKDGIGHQRSSQSTFNSRKRKENDSGDGSDGRDDNVGPRRRWCDFKSPTSLKDRLLACPFNKYDNGLFGPDSPDEAYHACATCSFVNIAHLK